MNTTNKCSNKSCWKFGSIFYNEKWYCWNHAPESSKKAERQLRSTKNNCQIQRDKCQTKDFLEKSREYMPDSTQGLTNDNFNKKVGGGNEKEKTHAS